MLELPQDGALSISKQLPLSLCKLYLNWKDCADNGQWIEVDEAVFSCAQISER
jgi:hypothetical protein